MKANSKKVQAYKANKKAEEARQKRQAMLDKMTEEEKANFLEQEKARQNASLKKVAELFSFADSIGGPYKT